MIKTGRFDLQAPFGLTGDQPQAVDKIVSGLHNGKKHQLWKMDDYYLC